MTNSFIPVNVVNCMFATRFITSFKREKRTRTPKRDIISEQVKKMLQEADQKLILMVRG